MTVSARDTILIIPALNEASNLPDLLARVAEHAPDVDVLVVDDGSTDGTADLARAAGATVLALPFNLGIGAAMETGYTYAYRAGYRFAARIDGRRAARPGRDRPRPGAGPRRRGRLRGRVAVPGGRLEERDDPAAALRHRLLFDAGQPVHPADRDRSDLGLSRDEPRRSWACFTREFPTDFPEVESLLFLHRLGFRATEVAVRPHPRRGGRSSITFLRSLYYMYKVTFALLILTVRDYPSGPKPGGPKR